jgi:predicted DNA-binding protein
MDSGFGRKVWCVGSRFCGGIIMFKGIKHYFYRFKKGIQNLINWFPVIWQDEDFDHYYFHNIILHKLKSMEKFFISDNAYSADSDKYANDIYYAVQLLERIIADDYINESLQPFHEKYPNCNLSHTGTEEQEKFKYTCYMNSDQLREKDYDEFYKYLRDNVQEWWD